MKLFTFAGAPNPRRVHIYLAEKGIEVPFEQVDIMTRANRTPEFISRVNAMGGLPVLELDDGSHIAESIAICRYLESFHPDPPLMGADPKSAAVIEMWERRAEMEGMQAVAELFRNGHPAFVDRGLPAEDPAVALLGQHRDLGTALALPDRIQHRRREDAVPYSTQHDDQHDQPIYV